MRICSGAGAALGVDLPLFAALVAACDVMVTVDSGLYHLAAAVRTPAVGVFGITSGPLMRRFYPRHSEVSAGPTEREGLPCDSPCYAFRRPSEGDDCRGKACPTLARVPLGRVAAEPLRLLAA